MTTKGYEQMTQGLSAEFLAEQSARVVEAKKAKQRALDDVFKALFDQGRTSWSDSHHCCAYYTKDDDGSELRCSIGILMGDAAVRYGDADIPAEAIWHNMPDENRIRSLDVRFLSALQRAHDQVDPAFRGADFREDLYRRFLKVANDFGLSSLYIGRVYRGLPTV